MGSVMRPREVRKVGGPKAQKLWRLGEGEQDFMENYERKSTDASQRSCLEDSWAYDKLYSLNTV
jgi:hypothetical protein